ncbi:glycosyltransferase [Marinomonas atlantica]|uniref:glycosyltransferase n=1 Tax=Marinomonas atlantica TaxID=1806668 RepID=UPI0008332ABA|nr:glycosyltransferase [Marinomonas atlantica]
MNHPIDVIVPVYRGLQDVIDCLDSIKASHNQQPYELILIDDCSPEPEVSALLRERAALGDYTLLVNEENLGFVATVNRGMQLHPERDVLLLNSDTLVVNDWVDRITKAAYADERIGTVTPFSNNATICSYPDFCQDNDLASNTPLSLLDKIVAHTNAGKAVDVPSGVGFCMYIRRACLDDLGYFDVETFGKGYGEENDFCQRAIKAGWKNRFAMDTFVQHTGNVSFGDEHNELKHTALGKLLKRHPRYDVDVQRHIAEDPAKAARVRTWLASLRFGAQPITVHVSHNRGGGTVRFIEELSQAISEQCYSLMLMPSLKKPGYLVLTRIAHGADASATEESEYSLYFEAHSQQELLQDVLSQLPLAGFHFHHMIGLPRWVMSLPKDLNKPWFVSLHDYYFVHESISLTNDQGVYLTADNLEVDPNWTQSFSSLLNGAKLCFAPSNACHDIYKAVFPNANVVTQYHENGRFLKHDTFTVKPLKTSANTPLKVVVVGALSKIKGADLLEDTARLCAKQGLNIEFELIGYGYRELQAKPKTTLSVSGRFQESELVEMLMSRHSSGNADVVWFTALWPETYSYTLSAAIEAGLPIVAPNIGAFSERLHGRQQSWIVPWQNTAEQMAKLFKAMQDKGSEANELNAFISQQPPAKQHMSYEESYLALALQGAAPVKLQTLENQSLLVWLSQTQPLTNSELSINQRLRRKALYGLFQLRQAPLLRAVAKHVPLSMQRRIRDRLMK